MQKYLRNASPEAYFAVSALIGLVIAAVISRISVFGFSFLGLLGVLLSVDAVTYIAMKAGWIRTPRQRNGRES